MKVGKSCGLDMISLRLLKECVNSISSPLCTLFNKQLGSGCFPKLWNVANLDPVFKSDDKEIVDNYRGISLLSVVSKVLQKCIFSRVFPFFQTKLYHLQDSWKLSTETISVSVHVIFYFEVLLAFILIFETENRIKLSSQNTGQINHPISFLIKKPITSLFWMLHESLRTSSLGEPLCKRQKMNLIWCGLRWPRTEISRALFPTKHMKVYTSW